MEVKIGVQHVQRELILDTNEDPEAIEQTVAQALTSGLLTLTDSKGRRVVVPADKLAYVEIGGSIVGPVGFRS